MSTKEVTRVNNGTLIESARSIDKTAGAAMELFQHAGSLETEVSLALAIQDLRAMLTPEIMRPIMALANTRLGFLTDRDPKQRDRDGKAPVPYSEEVIRDVVIEAKLRGFHIVGNEFNVIAHSFYAAKAGFRRKLTDGKTFPGLSNFKDSYDVPRVVGDKGAIVKCSAIWDMNGKPDPRCPLVCEFAVKVNAFMGADAIIGKAERKLLKRVHDVIAGVNTPDGEAGDTDMPQAKVSEEPTTVVVRSGQRQKPAEEDQIPGAEFPANPQQGRVTDPPIPTEKVLGVEVRSTSSVTEVDESSVEPRPPARTKKSASLALLQRTLAGGGFTEEEALAEIHRMRPHTNGCGSLDEVDALGDSTITEVARAWSKFSAAMIAARSEQ